MKKPTVIKVSPDIIKFFSDLNNFFNQKNSNNTIISGDTFVSSVNSARSRQSFADKIKPYLSPFRPRAITSIGGGSCNIKEAANSLLLIKLYTEFKHDFGSERGKILKATQFNGTNLYETILKKLHDITDSANTEIPTPYEKDLIGTLKQNMSLLDENQYMTIIFEKMYVECPEMLDLLYIDTKQLKYEGTQPDITNVLNKISALYSDKTNALIFAKDTDSIDPTKEKGKEKEKIHLCIYMGPILPGKPMQLRMVDTQIEYDILTNVEGLKRQFDTENNITDKILSQLSNNNPGYYGFEMNILLGGIKTTSIEQTIKTPAKLIDPSTLGGFDITDATDGFIGADRVIITQYTDKEQNNLNDSLNKNADFQNAIYLATLYGINKLFNVWIDNTAIFYKYKLVPESSAKANGIKFITKDDNENDISYDWIVADSTVPNICDVIIKYIKDNNNTRMHELANFIINHENFRYKKDGNWNNTNPEFQEYFMVLLAFLKSCGDELQRLTCEYMNNYLTALKNVKANPVTSNGSADSQETITELSQLNADNTSSTLFPFNVPDNEYIGIDTIEVQNLDILISLLGKFIELITVDRVLVAESLKFNTPFLTNATFDCFKTDTNEDVTSDIPGIVTKCLFSNRKGYYQTEDPETIKNNIKENKAKIASFIMQIQPKIGSIPQDGQQLTNLQYLFKEIVIVADVPDVPDVDDERAIISRQNLAISYFFVLLNSIEYLTFQTENPDANAFALDDYIEKLFAGYVKTVFERDITLQKLQSKSPTSVRGVLALIETMNSQKYGPKTYMELIKAYEKACESCLQKIQRQQISLDSLNKKLTPPDNNYLPQADGGYGETKGEQQTPQDNIITQGLYNACIKHVNDKNDEYKAKIINMIEKELNAKMNKRTSSRSGDGSVRKSFASAELDETIIPTIEANIANLNTQIGIIDKQIETKRSEISSKISGLEDKLSILKENIAKFEQNKDKIEKIVAQINKLKQTENPPSLLRSKGKMLKELDSETSKLQIEMARCSKVIVNSTPESLKEILSELKSEKAMEVLGAEEPKSAPIQDEMEVISAAPPVATEPAPVSAEPVAETINQSIQIILEEPVPISMMLDDVIKTDANKKISRLKQVRNIISNRVQRMQQDIKTTVSDVISGATSLFSRVNGVATGRGGSSNNKTRKQRRHKYNTKKRGHKNLENKKSKIKRQKIKRQSKNKKNEKY